MTIYEIKRLTADTAPHFFTRQSLKFFGQRMSDFSVCRQEDGRYRVSAPYGPGKPRGQTVRFFNPATNKLDLQ